VNPKERAAAAAVQRVMSGTTIGLGTGSTANCFVKALGEQIRQGRVTDVRGVPTSARTAKLATEQGIPLVSLDDFPILDAVFDGADEIDPFGNMTKGGGGSLLREKIVAQAARTRVVLVDESKCVDRLGTTFALPIEVVPFGAKNHFESLTELGGKPALRKNEDGTPFLTDEGNYTIDIDFRSRGISDLEGLQAELQTRVGIVETGLFLGLCDLVIVGSDSGVKEREPQQDDGSMRVGHIELFVADPIKSGDFYASALGFRLVGVQEESFVWLELDGVEILLRPARADRGVGEGPRATDYEDSQTGIVLYTHELAENVASLQEMGVSVERLKDSSDCFVFQDPDGNWFQLVDPSDH